METLARARALALGVPLLLMAGALGSQYLGGLFPCEYCHWQRWPHYAASALAILTSGAIGVYHAGVEYGWWEGLTRCSAPGSGSIADILQAPPIRCDEVQWSIFHISLAGFNFLISTIAGLGIIGLLLRKAQ
jgi:disulfide bond formation protein DsbB